MSPVERAELDEHGKPGKADDVDALGDRVRHVKLGIGHQARQHGRHGDVEDTVQMISEPRMPIGMSRCGCLRFLRGGRDGVEADEGEEHHRGAAQHAAPAEMAELAGVGGTKGCQLAGLT